MDVIGKNVHIGAILVFVLPVLGVDDASVLRQSKFRGKVERRNVEKHEITGSCSMQSIKLFIYAINVVQNGQVCPVVSKEPSRAKVIGANPDCTISQFILVRSLFNQGKQHICMLTIWSRWLDWPETHSRCTCCPPRSLALG